MPRRCPSRCASQALKIKYAPYEESLAAVSAMILQNWKFDRERIRPALGPTIPHHCSDEFLAGCRDLAKELGVGMQMHVGESKMQAVVGAEDYGKTLVAHLDRLEAPARDSASRTGSGSTTTTARGSPTPAARSRTTPAAT